MAFILHLIVVVVIITHIQGEDEDGLRFTDLFKGIEEDEHEYDDVMKIQVTNPRPMSASKEATVWDNGTVPYEISDKFSEKDRNLIQSAIDEFHQQTCVRFRPRKGEASHIFLEPGEGGCSALQGKIPNKANNVWLDGICMSKGVVMHELMHALGMIHEQNRPDRDQYVKINYNNIDKNVKHNFDKYKPGEVYTFGQPYDYESIMHYGPHEHAKDPRMRTVIPLQQGVNIGQRMGFSKIDLIKIKALYKCNMEQIKKEQIQEATKVSNK